MTTVLDDLEPVVEEAGGPATAVFGVGLHEAAIRRFEQSGTGRLVEEPGEADVVVASTRIPRRRSVAALVDEIRQQAPDRPLLVLVHPGGEPLAVEFLMAGARAVVAEGNEAQILQWVSGRPTDEPLVETYERRMDRRLDRQAAGVTIGLSPFESRVRELTQAGIARIGLVRIPDWRRATSRLSSEALTLLERRIHVQFEDLCRAAGGELHQIGPGEYGVIGRELSARSADELGRKLAAVAASFSPDRTTSLGLAMGHVGPEVTNEPSTLMELARRALDLAASPEGPGVVNADDLSRALASSTELDTVYQALRLVERQDPAGEGHGARVAATVTRLAEHLGIEGRELVRIRLAAELHDVGKVSLPEGHAYSPDPDDPEALEAYRCHPMLGGEALRAAGWDVAAAIRHHHENWDGTGFPDGLAGEDIPLAARLIAVADAIDRHSLDRVEEEAGTVFDPEIARLAIQVLK
jgi:HD-GYP domain-containing protein (c-di-GMP phosphodiesterase class II)